MINVSLLKQICEVAGAPGFEQRVREMVINEVTPLVDDLQVDAMGNVIAIKKGRSSEKKVMVAAHMDEIGFIVTHIDNKGFIKFHTLGGFDPKTLTAQRVIIHGKKDVIGVMGSKPIHIMSADERSKAVKTKDFFIDTGLTKAEVEANIQVGDPITRERSLIQMGDCVNCKSLDNRVSVFILLETLRQLQDVEVPFDVYATFTVQEEVGIRGASVAAQQINPDFGIALDVTIAYDLPGAQSHESITQLGEGTAIKIMDGGVICDYRMVNYLKATANSHNIKWQPEILTGGATDTRGLQQRGRNGAIAGAISIPTRYIHQVIEMAHQKDIYDSIALLKFALLKLDTYDWSFN